MQRQVERLDGALGPEVAAVGDPRQMPTLLRELPVAGKEDPRQLEERDPLDAGVAIPTVNDSFTGRAPDLGALEVGKPAPKYGPRWLKGQPFYR